MHEGENKVIACRTIKNTVNFSIAGKEHGGENRLFKEQNIINNNY